MSRPEDIQFRLAEWLLDQLKSQTEFETVSQQISLLVSQAREQSIGELYARIGKAIFQKMIQIEQGGPTLIRLCFQLCHSLLAIHFRQHSALSPRVSPVHEYILRLCIDSVPIRAHQISDSAHGVSAGATVTHTSATPPDVTLEKICEIVLQFYKYRLISLVQVLEYMFRVFEQRKTFAGSTLTAALAGVRGLLKACSLDPCLITWKNEVDPLRDWVGDYSDSNAEQSSVTVNGNTLAKGSHLSNTEHSNKEHSGLSPSVSIFRPVVGNVTLGSGASSSNDNGFASNSIKDPVSPNGTHSPDQRGKGAEMDDRTGNNHGSPPNPAGSSGFTRVSTKVSEPNRGAQNMPIPASSTGSIVPCAPGTFRASPVLNPPSAANQTPKASVHGSGKYTTNRATFGLVKGALSFTAAIPATPTGRLANGVNSTLPKPSRLILTMPALTETTPIGNSNQKKMNVHALFNQGSAPIPTSTSAPDEKDYAKAAALPVQSIATPLSQLAFSPTPSWPPPPPDFRQSSCNDEPGVLPNYPHSTEYYESPDDDVYGSHQIDSDEDNYPDEDDCYPDYY